jgi:hypothetical protein
MDMNQLFDRLSDYLAHRRGMLPLIGLLLIILNFVVHLILGLLGVQSWFASSHLLLHLGLIISIIGILLIKPLQ